MLQKLAVDLRFAGYATTIGVAEFHEMKLNRLNYDQLLKNPSLLTGTPGRKAKVECTTWLVLNPRLRVMG